VGYTVVFAVNIPDATIDVTLELRMTDNKSRGTITVQLNGVDSPAAGAVPIANAMQDIRLGGVDHSAAALDSTALKVLDGGVAAVGSTANSLNSLSNVISKLGLFVQIVDKTAKVNISHRHIT
jgi:hypothetical protein